MNITTTCSSQVCFPSITSGDNLVVKSQIEQGDGNPDIIIDNRSSREAVILELKKADGKDISKLKNAAETALEQIRKITMTVI